MVVFPPPPEPARIQFLTSFSNSVDVTGERSGLLSYILGPDKGKPINKPYGIAIHKGKIYICETMLGHIDVIDLERRTFEYFRPKGKGKLKKPINCSVDADGNLYVADSQRGEVVIFDEKGNFRATLGTEGMKPTDVCVFGNNVWISDLSVQKVQVFDRSSRSLLYSFPDIRPQRPGFLFSPVNLTATSDKVFVSDFGDFKIKIFDRTGAFVSAIGSYGRNLGQFARPKGIAVDRDQNLYVVDSAFENVQVFNATGQLLMVLGGSYTGPGFMWLPAKVMIDYDNLEYFQQYVYEGFELKYLIFVTNQFGPEKISIYGFVEAKG